jgi:hypothetical protein
MVKLNHECFICETCNWPYCKNIIQYGHFFLSNRYHVPNRLPFECHICTHLRQIAWKALERDCIDNYNYTFFEIKKTIIKAELAVPNRRHRKQNYPLQKLLYNFEEITVNEFVMLVNNFQLARNYRVYPNTAIYLDKLGVKVNNSNINCV